MIGILDSLRERVRAVAAAADAQDAAAGRAARGVERPTTRPARTCAARLADGSVLRGEVLARWQEFVATGDVFRSLEPGGEPAARPDPGRRGRGWRRRSPCSTRSPPASRTSSLAVPAARSSALPRWAGGNAPARGGAAGRGDPELNALPADFGERAARAVREWRASLTDLVRELPLEGAPAGGARPGRRVAASRRARR